LRGVWFEAASIGAMRDARERRLFRFGPPLLAVAVACELKVLIDGEPLVSGISALLVASSGLLLLIARDALRRGS
jgi:hypothetical protein